MPSSKETRVRVEGFSKIMASALPASGFASPCGGFFALKAAPISRMSRSCARGRTSRSRKWRGTELRRLPGGSSFLEDVEGFVDMAVVDDEWRQQAHHIVACAGGEHAVLAQFGDHLGIRHPAFEADQKPFAPHLFDQFGVAPGKLLEPAAQALGHRLHAFEEAI